MFHFFETPILCGPKLMRKTMPCNHTKTKSYEVFTIRSHDMKHTRLHFLGNQHLLLNIIMIPLFLMFSYLANPKLFSKRKPKGKMVRNHLLFFW
jgi:hypothetical protein